MLRFLFFLLAIVCAALAVAIYLADSRPPTDVVREINPGALKIVSVTESGRAQQEALTKKRIVDSLNGSACVDFSVKPADAGRAQTAFAELQLGARLNMRNIEDFTRFGVATAAQNDKRVADTLLANLKKAGVKDVSILPDNSISLGVFSSEEAARRYLSGLESKAGTLLKGAVISPRNPVSRETVFTIKEPDINLIARLTVMQRDFDSSVLKAVSCEVQAPVAAIPAPANAPAATPAVATSIKGK
jgi:hypothetical protein